MKVFSLPTNTEVAGTGLPSLLGLGSELVPSRDGLAIGKNGWSALPGRLDGERTPFETLLADAELHMDAANAGFLMAAPAALPPNVAQTPIPVLLASGITTDLRSSELDSVSGSSLNALAIDERLVVSSTPNELATTESSPTTMWRDHRPLELATSRSASDPARDAVSQIIDSPPQVAPETTIEGEASAKHEAASDTASAIPNLVATSADEHSVPIETDASAMTHYDFDHTAELKPAVPETSHRSFSERSLTGRNLSPRGRQDVREIAPDEVLVKVMGSTRDRVESALEQPAREFFDQPEPNTRLRRVAEPRSSEPQHIGFNSTHDGLHEPIRESLSEPKDVVSQLTATMQAHEEPLRSGQPIEIHLRLDPPELGTVRVHLRLVDDVVSVRFVSGSDAVSQLLESQLPDLRQSLAERGLEFAHAGSSNQQQQPHSEQVPDSWLEAAPRSRSRWSSTTAADSRAFVSRRSNSNWLA